MKEIRSDLLFVNFVGVLNEIRVGYRYVMLLEYPK